MTKFEEYLQNKHAALDLAADGNLPDFRNWIANLDPGEWIIYGTGYGELTVEEFIEETHEEIKDEKI